MGEQERGCGWRQIGGVYLVAESGMHVGCDSLPTELKPCPCCEYDVDQRRSVVPYHAGYLAAMLAGHKCKDPYPCPLCYFAEKYHAAKKRNAERIVRNATRTDGFFEGLEYVPKHFFLMWVSKDFYSTTSFVMEAKSQGISKRVAANSLPNEFVMGRDWIFLAHGETPFYPKDSTGQYEFDKPMLKKGIFYAFKPKRLELVLWKGTADDVIQQYEEAGYFVVLLEKTKENIERHGDGAYPPLPTGKGKAVRKTGLAPEDDDGEEPVGDRGKGGMSGPVDRRSFNERHTIPNPKKKKAKPTGENGRGFVDFESDRGA